MSTNSTCSVDECDKKAGTRGWCPAHYQRWRETGDVQAHIPIRTRKANGAKRDACTVNGCSKDAATRGWCQVHYARWKNNGDVQAGIPVRENISRSTYQACTVDGCELKPLTRGLCGGHYDRLLRDGDVRADVPLKTISQKGNTCSVAECGEPAFCRGWCRTHYQRWRTTGDVRADVPINGHLREYPEGHSWCPKCEQMLPLGSFHTSNDRARGVSGVCAACVLSAQKANRSQIYVQQRRWHQRNPGKVAEYSRRYAQKHPDRIREKQRRLVANKPELYRKIRRAGEANRRARVRNAPGRVTSHQLNARWEYYGGRCWICGGVGTVTEHVKPLAAGGSNWPSNLRPACVPCNSSKSDKWPFDRSMIRKAD